MDPLATLGDEIVACRACPRLVAWREEVAATKRAAFRDQDYWGRAVPGFGDPAARLVVIGLAPAAHGANRTGRMFTGDRSGEWLYRALWRAGYANRAESVSRDDGLVLTGAYITAPVRCAPPANKPTPDERARCRPFFERELALLTEARVYLALGQIGYQTASGVLGIRPRPAFAHGLEVPVPAPPGRPRTLLCSYHVSQQNTFTGRLTEAMLDAVFSRAPRAHDLREANPTDLAHPGRSVRASGPNDPAGRARGWGVRLIGSDPSGSFGDHLGRRPHSQSSGPTDDASMRASIRRIDLTQSPAVVDAWPSTDWLSSEPDSTGAAPLTGPRGRGGLWAAMAGAVARAREASTSGVDGAGDVAVDAQAEPAEVIDLVTEAPHLAYLARVACNSEVDDDDVADVIEFDASRARDLR